MARAQNAAAARRFKCVALSIVIPGSRVIGGGHSSGTLRLGSRAAASTGKTVGECKMAIRERFRGGVHSSKRPPNARIECARPFIPNGEWLGNVWIPLNELTVVFRSGNTLNRFCAPAASVYAGDADTTPRRRSATSRVGLVVGRVQREAAELAVARDVDVRAEAAAAPVAAERAGCPSAGRIRCGAARCDRTAPTRSRPAAAAWRSRRRSSSACCCSRRAAARRPRLSSARR